MYHFYRKHYSRSIKSIDYLVLLGVILRAAWNLCTAALHILFKKKSQA